MKFFDLLILDVDGVLTDGTKTYDVDGNVISKRFCDKDFTAIKKFKAVGVEVVWLSGDRQVNEAVARKRGIDFYCSRDKADKADFLPRFAEIYNTSVDRMAYVGDDIFDRNIMLNIGWPFHVSNCDRMIGQIRGEQRPKFWTKASYKLTAGDNAIKTLFDMWKFNGGDVPTLDQIVALDNAEPSTEEMS